MASQAVKTFTSADVKEENLRGKGLVLVDFWASWCGPCRMMSAVVDQLAEEYQGRVLVGKLNVDEQGEAAMAYSVSSIPTLILFKDGQMVERLVGARPKAALSEVIDRHL